MTGVTASKSSSVDAASQGTVEADLGFKWLSMYYSEAQSFNGRILFQSLQEVNKLTALPKIEDHATEALACPNTFPRPLMHGELDAFCSNTFTFMSFCSKYSF
jgi:hypothetical protein